jgi:L-histidine N-alpha-methyltransferase
MNPHPVPSDTTGTTGPQAPVDESDHLGELRRALQSRPRTIPPRWLNDDRGSELFDEITRLTEYYPTEAEREILATHSAMIAEVTAATTVIELGSGTSDKTRTLLFAAEVLDRRYPDLTVEPVVGDFTQHLSRLPAGGTRLVAFLGGTIGNFYREERRAFLGALSDTLEPGDWLLLGVDLVKPLDRIVDAYDDSQGVTDAFIRNSLHAINRELDADFDVGNFEYVALWDSRERRVDMRLRAGEPEHAHIGALDLDVVFEPGEEIRVEISTKFRPADLVEELGEAGFRDVEFLTDTNDDFALALTRRM